MKKNIRSASNPIQPVRQTYWDWCALHQRADGELCIHVIFPLILIQLMP